jgi:hypothetical protein
MTRLKRMIKDSLEKCGLNRPPVHIDRARSSALLYNKIDLLLDVGANTGQYAQSAREAGFQNTIVSFEPLSEAHKTPGWQF